MNKLHPTCDKSITPPTKGVHLPNRLSSIVIHSLCGTIHLPLAHDASNVKSHASTHAVSTVGKCLVAKIQFQKWCC